jgi:hypothetical protein
MFRPWFGFPPSSANPGDSAAAVVGGAADSRPFLILLLVGLGISSQPPLRAVRGARR